MKLPDTVIRYAQETLRDLVALPSVSAERRALPETARRVKELLEELGLEAEIHPTPGAPVVYAEGGEGGPTVLFYNHYDVQPADPLELWESDPFTMTEREGHWYARGVSDDKGELTSRLAALRWLIDEHGKLPFRVKFVVEGEEEVGSPNLEAYVAQNRQRLQADAVIWEFGSVDTSGRPLVYCGLKGIVAVELRVRTAGYDLHSSLGAVVQNPIYRLAAALASLRDNDGKVLIEGFYDRVRPLSEAEAESLQTIPDESEQVAALYGVKGFLGGAEGVEFYRRLAAEPVVNVNGFHSGYGGPGSKTVLPAEAFAKLDFRLVPDQEPLEVVELLRAHLERHGFDDVEVITLEAGEHPARSDLGAPWVRQAVEALRETYGLEPVVHLSSGGSGPMYPFTHHLGAPVVSIGISYPGSRVHSPNENIRIADFERGVAAIKRALEKFAGL
ncbi:Succinyl-diaminopimelate desuccinylase [Calidithermus terrae]|uniref:Succinyl-diaminopimelate desuccinylase n=1 Tax=Calidithermus terrae TaxID=1408545 RepID=A0A399EPV7_9DEIN|nr:M20/M25/M40 family metallo-hydrolase [Calidithermus terrae]RIH86714.1 Succinyl-diaminopimelate desuccinylase [Calidithermus terrae]